MKSTFYTTEAEKQYLRDHYRDMTNGELAHALHITPQAVSCRLFRLGLKREPDDPASIKSYEANMSGIRQACFKGGKARSSLTRKERLETDKTPLELRLYYAKYLYGKSLHFPTELVPRTYLGKAGLSDFAPKPCLNMIVEELALNWGTFSKKQAYDYA